VKLFALQVDDELKKIKPKDPKLMTARQRAMFERKTDKEPSPGGEQLLALPSGKLTYSFQCHFVKLPTSVKGFAYLNMCFQITLL
jgi:hypothetical protein